jgi:hypothetical protein
MNASSPDVQPATMLPGPPEKISSLPIAGGFSFYTHTGLCVEFCAPAIFKRDSVSIQYFIRRNFGIFGKTEI